MMGYGGFGMLGGFGWIWMLLPWIAAIGLIVWGVTTALGSRAKGSGPDALQILRQRYARGEITQAGYEQIQRVLS